MRNHGQLRHWRQLSGEALGVKITEDFPDRIAAQITTFPPVPSRLHVHAEFIREGAKRVSVDAEGAMTSRINTFLYSRISC